MTSLRRVISATGAKMKVDFDEISKETQHMGERGRAREDAISAFLKAYLPDRVGVGRGVIIDHTGKRSKECDIVLYDKQSTPLFWLSESVRLFPAETVFLVLQVKSRLTKRELKSAMDNIGSVAQLRRSSDPGEPLLAGFALSRLFTKGPFTVTYSPGTVPGGIFAFDSPSLGRLVDNVEEQLRARPRDEWALFVVSLAKGSVLYGKQTSAGHDPVVAREADSVVGMPAEEHGPLVILYMMTTSIAQITISACPDLRSYLGLGSSKGVFARIGGSATEATG